MKQAFLTWLTEQVGEIYVWGGTGEEMNPERIRKMESSAENAQRAIALYEKRRAEGKSPIRGYDCSGLVSRFLQDHGLAVKKRNCNHLAAMCPKIHTFEEEVPLMSADLLFRYDGKKPYFHVGVYMGGGMALESMGRDDGVVLRRLDASGKGYWNRWGRLPFFEEDARYGVCGGGSVHLRSGAGKEHPSLGTLHKGDKVLFLAEDGWPQVAACIGGKLTVGYMSPAYLEEAEL